MTLDVFVQSHTASAAAVEEKIYTVTPVSVKVEAGIVTGEITDMQVTERLEPRLTGTLRLRNTTATHSVRLVAAKIEYLDGQWRPIKLEGSLIEARFKFTAPGSERLDPGQETVQAVDVPFPAAALEARKLKGLRLEITQVSSPFREEVITFAVSIGSPGADSSSGATGV